MLPLAALLPAALLAAPPAAAQDTQHPPPGLLRPGIGPQDPRRPVDPDQPPWRALARVQTELGGRCTGAMLAPDRALTAAHCLVSPRTGRFVQPRSVHVLLGYDRGGWVGAARVAEFVLDPAYDPARGQATRDWALLVLDRPIAASDRTIRLLAAPPEPGSPAMLAGFQQDRPETLLADTGCRLLGARRFADGLEALAHGCAGTRGASGAPVLARGPGGGWAVAGVQSAVARDAAFGLAVPAATVAAGLAAALNPKR